MHTQITTLCKNGPKKEIILSYNWALREENPILIALLLENSYITDKIALLYVLNIPKLITPKASSCLQTIAKKHPYAIVENPKIFKDMIEIPDTFYKNGFMRSNMHPLSDDVNTSGDCYDQDTEIEFALGQNIVKPWIRIKFYEHIKKMPTLHCLLIYRPRNKDFSFKPRSYEAIEILLKNNINPDFKFEDISACEYVTNNSGLFTHEEFNRIQNLFKNYTRNPRNTCDIIYPPNV